MNSSGLSKLIVNADDYGMTKAISKGILKAHTEGIVTSISIVTNTPDFKETISWVSDLDVDKGIHLTLNSGKPISVSIPKLPIIKADGTFYRSPIYKPFIYFICQSEVEQWILDEFKRQIEKLLNAGVNITHLDSHFHVHAFPKIAKIILKLIKEYNIPYVRKPYEASVKKRILHPVYNLISYLCQINSSYIGAISLPFYGLTEAGRINKEVLQVILKEATPEIGEMMIHPGYNSVENLKYYPANVNNFENELEAAIHPHTNALLKKHKIKLIKRNQI